MFHTACCSVKKKQCPDSDRRALQYASIEGEEFTSTILAALLDTDELELEQRLDRLERAHYLVETRGEEELPDGSLATRYRFTHALYQNVLYEDLLSKHRTLLHRQAGEQMVRRFGAQAGKVASALAIHFERGRDYTRAIDYFTQAAGVAIERYAGSAAEEDYTRALRLAERLPAADRLPAEFRLLEKRGVVRMALGRLLEAEEDFTAMRERASANGDALHECRALNALGNPFLTVQSHGMGRADEAGWPTSGADSSTSVTAERMEKMGTDAQRAIELAKQIGNPALQAEAMVNLALRHSVLGEPVLAKSLFEAAIPIARSAGHHQALLTTLTYRGVGHFFQTEFREAEERLGEASELGFRLRNGLLLRTAMFFLGWTQASLGKISEALATLNELREMAERNGDAHFVMRAERRVRWIHEELADCRITLFLGSRGAEDAREHRVRVEYLSGGFSGVRPQTQVAEEFLANGDFERAREVASKLLANSMRHGPPKYVVTAHRILAEIAAAYGDLAEAEAELAAALEPLRTNPAPLVAWKTYAMLGDLYRRKDNAHAAREAFSQAAEIVHHIASNIDDDRLRSAFLETAAVRRVLALGRSIVRNTKRCNDANPQA